MANTIGTEYIQIEPSFDGVSSKIDKELGGAGESGGKSFGSGFAKVMGGTGKAIAGAVAVGAAATTALTTGFVNATNSVASYGDNIDKMSQKMGMSAEAYQEWDAVMQHSGTSMETMKSSMKTLATAAETGKDAFDKLGISQEQIANMSQEQLFESTITALQNVEDETERTYLAGQVLGKGATELGALLNTSAEDTQAMRDRVRELGGVMSDEAVKAAAAYQDQMQDMQTAFSGLSRNLTSEFLPAVTEVMSGLTEIFSGNTEEGLGQISNGINAIVDGITQNLPQLMEVATTIIQALATAIIENLPTIAQCAMDIITQLAQYIIENLPTLLETGLQILMELALGIAEALPTLIPTMVEVITNMVIYLLDNIDLLIEAAVQLMIGLTTGLVNAIPILIEKAPIIIAKLVAALLQAIPKLLEAGKQCILMIKDGLVQTLPTLLQKGQELMTKLKEKILEKVKQFTELGKNIVDGIKKGIADAWESLLGWFTDKLSSFLGAVKKYFGISSPSKLMAKEVGQWIPAGIAEGIENGMGVLNSAVDDMTGQVLGTTVDAMVTGDVAYNGNNIQPEADNALYDLLATYLPLIASGENVNVTLEGDAGRLFKLMQRESIRNTQLVGKNAVLAAT